MRLWDTRTGRNVAHLRLGVTRGALFEPDGNRLLTSGAGGLRRWPIQWAGKGQSPTIGPPRFLDLPINEGLNRFDLAQDRLAVVDDLRESVSLDLNHPENLILLRGHPRMDHIVLSPDGRYAATGTWKGHNVRVYDAATGQTLTEIAAPESAYPAFTPDGKALLVMEDSRSRTYGRYQTGTWEPIRDFQPKDSLATRIRIAFAPDQRLMTLLYQRTNLRLINVETADQVATFSVPNPQLIVASEFSPDGRYLAVLTGKAVIQLWDLHAIRARLGAMGLDWDPATTPQMPAEEAGEPVALEVRGEFDRPPPRAPEVQKRFDAAARRADRLVLEFEEKMLSEQLVANPNDAKLLARRGRLRVQFGRSEDGIGDLTRSLELQPDQAVRLSLAVGCNRQAWKLLTGPLEQRNSVAALQLAEQAAFLTVNDRLILNTLGLAQLRNGRAKDAVNTLQQSLALDRGDFAAFDLYILSMCHTRLGDPAKAMDYFNRATKWHDEHHDRLSARLQKELREFRAEAQQGLTAASVKKGN